jgi:mRNA-degrading endonuclease RelE of RelBE toxin-antitoxin system
MKLFNIDFSVRDPRFFKRRGPIPIGKSRIKKLAGFDPPLFRLRSGDFRAYYRIRGDEVVILAVTRRKDSAKRLKRIAEEPTPPSTCSRRLAHKP